MATRRRVARRGAALIVASLHAGCATLAPQLPAAPEIDTLGRVAVIAGTSAPELNFQGFARNRAEGAARGAGSTFGSCAAAIQPGACSGAVCGAITVVWLGICGVAGVVGGVVGGATAPSATTVRDSETTLAAVFDAATIQESLRESVEQAALATGIVPVPPSEADTLLEVTLVAAGTSGEGVNAPVELEMRARIRLLQAADGIEISSADFTHRGERYTLAEWSANDGARLLAALEKGYRALATHIAESSLLLYPLPDQHPSTAGPLAVSFGLAPLAPRTRGTLSGDLVIGPRFEWTQVDSLRPTLRWEGFPRAADAAARPDEMARVERVTYDLVIAREQNLAPAEIVYERRGLTRPEHRLETALTTHTNYFWTVRARFILDGRTRVTGWGSTHYAARENLTAPSRYSYRFKTG